MKTNVGFLHSLVRKIEASAHVKPTFFFCYYVVITGDKICVGGNKEKPRARRGEITISIFQVALSFLALDALFLQRQFG